jgi:hypothetical protein
MPARAVNDNILGQYCSMISSPTGDVSVDNELKQICAFSFPAVLSVIGPKRWPSVREVSQKSFTQTIPLNFRI